MMMIRLTAALLPVSVVAAFALAPRSNQNPHEAPPAGAVPGADRGDKHFSTAWHTGRRKALVDAVKKGKSTPKRGRNQQNEGADAPTETDPAKGIIVLRGAPPRRDYQKFRQTNEFFYLTGVEAPGAALVIHIDSGKEALFLAKPSPIEGIFDDIRPHAPAKKIKDTNPAGDPPAGGDGNTKTKKKPRRADVQEEGERLAKELGFETILESTELDDYLADAAKGSVYTLYSTEEYEATSRDDASEYEHLQSGDKFDGRASRTMQFKARLEELYHVKTKDLTPALDTLRRVKTSEEIEAMRNAAKIAAAGHIAAMRGTKPGLKEWQVGAEATAVFYRMGAPSISYFPIVGTGKNALILHYTDIGETLQKDDVVLMDYAPEWRYYASDVTRSWPASGKFTEKGRKIYEAVQKAQQAAIDKVHPGASWNEVNQAAMNVLREEGFAPEKYMPHGLSHTIGMTTHDVGWVDPMEPGVVFTIEPGIYDKESGIGVRIEDVIAVTKDGYDNLSKDAPRGVAEIEAIVGKARH
ncbi:MAG: aminopeptidase P N-terminal domain-containing protein [Planctomycetes bacterium]|nr:aminopeptidase P N-terminal domain-containing protein [Planctomycetota bacterium]